MKIYGNLKVSGQFQTYYDVIGTGGTGGTGQTHHISNHYFDELPSLIGVKCEDCNVSIDNARNVINCNRIMISDGEDNFVNPAFIKSRPIGNTGVIIGGIDSRQNMEFINISVPSNSYHFADLYHECYDSCAASNGPLDSALIIEFNSTFVNFIWKFSIKTGVDVSFFGRCQYSVVSEASACSNRTLDQIRVCRTTNTNYTIDVSNPTASSNSSNLIYYHTTGSTSLSNSENDRGICFGGGQSNLANCGYNHGEYFTISTGSVGVNFGSLSSTYGVNDAASCSNGVYNRGIICGGQKKQWETSWLDGVSLSIIQHVNISVLSDAYDFGELNVALSQHSMTDNNIQGIGIIIGGTENTLQLDYISISTSGIANSFGELNNPRERHCSVSNG